MNETNDNTKFAAMAELLFPHVDKTPADYEVEYPPRDLPDSAMVTRLGPSPTGFIHLGNLYGAFVDERLAHQSGGTFYLRIEDTDDKRYVEGAVDTIIHSLEYFGINFDEGASLDGDKGAYVPYSQSERSDIYHCYARELVACGMAYPCFLTESEISEIRTKQEASKLTPGIYGNFARYRDISADEAHDLISQGKQYVLRLHSDGTPPDDAPNATDNVRHIKVHDGIRGELSMPENFQDIVLLKTNGIPTYHFAHAVDDHLMRTTHVVRGAEWLSSLPVHVELFEKLGFDLPIYCHTGQLMKLDENGNKRKLSKREDPELSLEYYKQEGYHPDAVKEYLLTILNSNYEEWRRDNPDAPADDFPFSISRMSAGGALFDLNKLRDISKDVLVKKSSAELCDFMKDWLRQYRPESLHLFEGNESYIQGILDLDRTGPKPRKDLINAPQIFDFIKYFFAECFEITDEYPENVPSDDINAILNGYLDTYDHKDDQETWFSKIRSMAVELGYAAKPKDYKKNPNDYKGHVGHVSTVIRIGLTGRAQSPDIWSIQQIMGEEEVRRRILAQIK